MIAARICSAIHFAGVSNTLRVDPLEESTLRQLANPPLRGNLQCRGQVAVRWMDQEQVNALCFKSRQKSLSVPMRQFQQCPLNRKCRIQFAELQNLGVVKFFSSNHPCNEGSRQRNDPSQQGQSTLFNVVNLLRDLKLLQQCGNVPNTGCSFSSPSEGLNDNGVSN